MNNPHAFESGCAFQELLLKHENWREKADRIAEGYVYFYEKEPIHVGLRHIDWNASHRQHQEWRAQLNRFFFLIPLAMAFRETDDERYAAAARAYIEDWIHYAATHGSSDKPFYNSPLCLSIRVGTSHHVGWCGVLPIFAGNKAFDSSFVSQLLTSVEEQLNWMRAHMTPLGNMRISEFDSLLMTALRHPHMGSAKAFREIGARGLRNVLPRQFLADGAHFELAPSYAAWMARVLADYAWLQTIVPDLELGIHQEQVTQALSYITHGMSFPVNDCWWPAGSTGAQLARSRRLLKRLDARLSDSWEPPRDQVFAKAGQVFLRTGWQADATSIGFDASPWGSTHTHASRLALNFHSGGRDLLADPGILSYEMSVPLAAHGKATRAHSTLCLNGLNQGQSGARLLRTEIHERCALIHARYDGGYWDGELTWGFRNGCGIGTHGIHDRLLFWVRDEYLLVMDVLVASPGNEIQNAWQLGPCDGIRLLEDRFAVQTTNADTNLHLQLVAIPEGATMSCAAGELEPPRGWVGQSYEEAGQVPAPHVVYSYPAGVPAGGISAVLAMPFNGTETPNVQVTRHCAGTGGIAQMLRLDFGDGRCDTIGWSPQLAFAIELGDEAQSDCTFFWLRQQDLGTPREGFLVDGSYVLVPEASKAEVQQSPGYWGKA